MKILMLNHEFPPVGGGASPVCFELCSELARGGHSVDVITMHYKGTAKFERLNGFNIERTAALRARVDICRPYELATYTPGAFFKALSLCRKNKYDIIHCHFIVPGGFLAYLLSKITGIPYIITSHGSDVPGHNPQRFILLHKIIKPLWRFLARGAKMIVSPSEFLRQRLLQADSSLQVEVIPNGIDGSRFSGAAEKEKRILLCGRMLEFKGFQYFIEAIRNMDLPDWRADIIGDGPYLPQLKKLAADCRMPVKFWGWLDKNSREYIELFEKAAVFVSLSSSESFGLVAAEAMAAGCAIIASDIAAHKEVLAEAGIFLRHNDTEQIANAIKKIINDDALRQSLQRQALQRITAEFSWGKIADRYVNLYNKII